MSVWDLPSSMHPTLYFIYHSYFMYRISTSRCSLLSAVNKPGCRLCPWKNNGFPLSGHIIDVTCSQTFSLRLTLLHRPFTSCSQQLLAPSIHFLLSASTSCSQHSLPTVFVPTLGVNHDPWNGPTLVYTTARQNVQSIVAIPGWSANLSVSSLTQLSPLLTETPTSSRSGNHQRRTFLFGDVRGTFGPEIGCLLSYYRYYQKYYLAQFHGPENHEIIRRE